MTSRAVSHAAGPARTTFRGTAALLAGAGLLALGACEQRPEPHPTYTQEAPPPPAPLAGEPDAAPTMAPPPTSEPPPPIAAPAPDQGLVAMAPIPNPEDGGPVPPSDATRSEGGSWSPSEPAHGYAHRHHHRPWREVHATARPAAPAPARPAARPAPHPTSHAAAKPAPLVVHAKPAAPSTHEHRASKHELAKAKGGTKASASNATSNSTGDDAGGAGDARAEAMRSALSAALANGAVLSVPKPQAEGASDVTLTVPASFFDTLQKEAVKDGMSDAAASVNLDAALSGDGWSIIPAGAQSQPLHAGQPTVFKWTVTAVKSATGADAGPLRANVNADLLGGGSQTLALGAIGQQGAGGGAFHWWGAALLAIVVLLGLGFLLRGSGGAAARRRPATGEVRRPFDMTNGNGDYRP